MPKSQIESTIADLGISLIAERTPALMDHYLGAEMVSSNEENTRVAALLGFQVGQELLYVPVLFLNGKIKGTEVLYLKNSDTFTSNSKQWVEFLTTKNPGIMGAGAQLPPGVNQPGTSQLSIFSRVPTQGKLALKLDKPFGEGAADDFFAKMGAMGEEEAMGELSKVLTVPEFLSKMGQKGYDDFMDFAVNQEPRVLEALLRYYKEADLMLEFPEEKTAGPMDGVKNILQGASKWLGPMSPASGAAAAAGRAVRGMTQPKPMNPVITQPKPMNPVGGVAAAAGRAPLGTTQPKPGINPAADYGGAGAVGGAPASIFAGNGGAAAGNARPGINPAADDSPRGYDASKVRALQEMREDYGPGAADHHNYPPHPIVPRPPQPIRTGPRPNMELPNEIPGPRGEPLPGPPKQINPGAYGAAPVAPTTLLGLGEQISTHVPTPGDPYGPNSERTSLSPNPEFPEVPQIPLGKEGECLVRFITSDEILDKTAAVSVDEAEKCFQDGFLVIDKRAADDKTKLYREDYRSRFDSPRENGFYEIINHAGNLEKVWIVTKPILLENPRHVVPGCIVLDLESGLYHGIIEGQQVFIRSKFTAQEAVWKDKMTGMKSVKSVTPGKSYMLIGPGLECSAPFRVTNKVSKGGQTDLIVATPWNLRYRASNARSLKNCNPCSFEDSDGVTVRIVDQPGSSSIQAVGSITYVPSDWKVIEVENSDDFPRSYDTEDGKVKARNTLRRIQPGDAGVVMSSILARGIFDIRLSKRGSYLSMTVAGENSGELTKAAAVRCLVEEIGLGVDDAIALFDEVQPLHTKTAWIQPVFAKYAEDPLPIAEGRAAGGALGATGLGLAGGLVGGVGGLIHGGKRDEKGKTHRLRNALIGAAAGMGLGGVGGYMLGGRWGQGVFERYNAGLAHDPHPGEDPMMAPGEVAHPAPAPVAPLGGGPRGEGPINEQSGAISARNHDAGPETLDGLRATLDYTVDPRYRKDGAHGLNAPGIIDAGTSFPDRNTDMGRHPSGFNEQQPTTQIQRVNLNSMQEPGHDWRDNDQANWDRIKPQDLNFLMRAADSGDKPVFDSAMIGTILRTNRGAAKVQEWLPEIVNGNDSKCRLLLTFYWHSKDFAEDYGKEELSEFEDVLLNSIKEDGKVILFLKQKAGESENSKIDALAGE